MSRHDPLLLGSASPRRRAILERLGIPFEVVIPRVREVFALHAPRWTALENARRKYRWCRSRHPDRRILTADTVVVFDGHCITKPESPTEARQFLRRFSGRSQQILTGVAYGGPGAPWRGTVETSSVRFRELDDPAIENYFARVDPMDKAGAYDIGQHGELVIAERQGSYTNIMGLPAETVARWLGLPVNRELDAHA